jgi:hypothetical protein
MAGDQSFFGAIDTWSEIPTTCHPHAVAWQAASLLLVVVQATIASATDGKKVGASLHMYSPYHRIAVF